MSIFEKLFGKKEDSKRSSSLPVKLELLEKAFAEFKETTALPIVKINPYRGSTSLTGSKFGGIPYFPATFPFPLGQSGTPLKLLVQLNFSEMPKLPGHPEQGLLQIFVLPDDIYGMNFDDRTAQKDFRIFYHENLDLPSIEEIPAVDVEEECFPFDGEFALAFEEDTMPMSSSDYRFNETFVKIYKKYFPEIKQTRVYGLHKDFGEDSDEIEEFLNDFIDELFDTKSRIGGYADFIQWDPREYSSNQLANHSVLLFQMNSEIPSGSKDYNDGILWGDAGIAQFLITPADLAQKDFSKVAYNWDCG